MFDYVFTWEDALEKLAARRNASSKNRRVRRATSIPFKDGLVLHHVSSNPSINFKDPMAGYAGIDINKLNRINAKHNVKRVGPGLAGLGVASGAAYGAKRYLARMKKQRNLTRGRAALAASLGAIGLGATLGNIDD